MSKPGKQTKIEFLKGAEAIRRVLNIQSAIPEVLKLHSLLLAAAHANLKDRVEVENAKAQDEGMWADYKMARSMLEAIKIREYIGTKNTGKESLRYAVLLAGLILGNKNPGNQEGEKVVNIMMGGLLQNTILDVEDLLTKEVSKWAGFPVINRNQDVRRITGLIESRSAHGSPHDMNALSVVIKEVGPIDYMHFFRYSWKALKNGTEETSVTDIYKDFMEPLARYLTICGILEDIIVKGGSRWKELNQVLNTLIRYYKKFKKNNHTYFPYTSRYDQGRSNIIHQIVRTQQAPKVMKKESKYNRKQIQKNLNHNIHDPMNVALPVLADYEKVRKPITNYGNSTYTDQNMVTSGNKQTKATSMGSKKYSTGATTKGHSKIRGPGDKIIYDTGDIKYSNAIVQSQPKSNKVQEIMNSNKMRSSRSKSGGQKSSWKFWK